MITTRYPMGVGRVGWLTCPLRSVFRTAWNTVVYRTGVRMFHMEQRLLYSAGVEHPKRVIGVGEST